MRRTVFAGASAIGLLVAVGAGAVQAESISYAESVPPLKGCLTLITGANGFDPLDDLLRNLKGDPFADAFGIYIDDLEPLKQEGEQLSQRMRSVERVNCGPFMEEQAHWESLRTELINSGCIGDVPEQQYAACAPRIANLNAWRDRLEGQRQRAQAAIDDVLEEANDLVDRAKMPVRNAENVLNPDHTEDAFRLYIWWYLKQHGTPPANSCEALAHLATVLAQRETDSDRFIDMLTRNLVNPDTPLRYIVKPPPWRPLAGRTFGAVGFKPKFASNAGDDQVRHAAAHLRLGYALTGGASAVYSFQSDLYSRYIHGQNPEWDDYYLGLAAGYLGFRLRSGLVLRSRFGDAIRADLCE